MLIAQITDTHIKLPGKLAYGRVDTASMLKTCVEELVRLDPRPDLIVITGDLVDIGCAEEYAHLKALLAPLRRPIVVVPGNHDGRESMRAAFADDGYLPATGFLQFAIDDTYPLRILGLDTHVPMAARGELCADRLAWLDETLRREQTRPTVLLMHHAPFVTGIRFMDDIGLDGRERFAEIVARHPQIEVILCGHLHRTIQTTVGGRRVSVCPSPAHQVALDLRPDAAGGLSLEPPGYMLHWWREGRIVTHSVALGSYGGPYPFVDAYGQLLDCTDPCRSDPMQAN